MSVEKESTHGEGLKNSVLGKVFLRQALRTYFCEGGMGIKNIPQNR
jgi:hypothetical protein